MTNQGVTTWTVRERVVAGLLVAVPALGLVQKYAGLAGAGLTVVLAPGAVALVDAVTSRMSTRAARLALAAVTLAAVAAWAAFILRYPQWDARVDRDEALDLAVREALSGRYPYAVRTQLDNPISPLPGALVLASPFVVLGTSALQNGAWLAGVSAWLARAAGPRESLRAVVLALLSPALAEEWAFGGDLFANAAYVALAAAAAVAAVTRGPVARAAAGVFLGLALASRWHWVAVVAPLAVALVHRGGRRSGVVVIAVALTTAAVLIVPVWAARPDAFSPLTSFGKLRTGIAGSAPALTLVLAATSFALAPRARTLAGVYAVTAIAIAAPLLGRVLLDSVAAGGVDFLFLKERHGVAVTWLGLLALTLTASSSR